MLVVAPLLLALHPATRIAPPRRALSPRCCEGPTELQAELLQELEAVELRGAKVNLATSLVLLEIVDALEKLDPSAQMGWENSPDLLGSGPTWQRPDWRLRYTSSTTFHDNGGLIGYASDLADVSTQELLLRFTEAKRAKGKLEFEEPLVRGEAADGGGWQRGLAESVVAQCTWSVAADGALKVKPNQFVAGERQWDAVDRRGTDTVDFERDKAIRVLCSCKPIYLDASLLLMRGLLPSVVWVFVRD